MVKPSKSLGLVLTLAGHKLLLDDFTDMLLAQERLPVLNNLHLSAGHLLELMHILHTGYCKI